MTGIADLESANAELSGLSEKHKSLKDRCVVGVPLVLLHAGVRACQQAHAEHACKYTCTHGWRRRAFFLHPLSPPSAAPSFRNWPAATHAHVFRNKQRCAVVTASIIGAVITPWLRSISLCGVVCMRFYAVPCLGVLLHGPH